MKISMRKFIQHHNYINGFRFSFLEFLAAAAILAPFEYYYLAHAQWLYAACAAGIIVNCLTIATFALPPIIKREPSVGIWKLYSDRDLRQQIGSNYPHLSRETLLLSAAVLIPFLIPATLVWDLG